MDEQYYYLIKRGDDYWTGEVFELPPCLAKKFADVDAAADEIKRRRLTTMGVLKVIAKNKSRLEKLADESPDLRRFLDGE